MSKKNVWAVVRGAGLLTAIFSKLSVALEKLGGPEAEEQLHKLSTDAGDATIGLMAEAIIRVQPRVCDFVMRPGVVIVWQENSGGCIRFYDEHGNDYYVWNGDNKICFSAIRTHQNFQDLVFFLSQFFDLLAKRSDIRGSDKHAYEFFARPK
jgi:hypothetical protein